MGLTTVQQLDIGSIPLRKGIISDSAFSRSCDRPESAAFGVGVCQKHQAAIRS